MQVYPYACIFSAVYQYTYILSAFRSGVCGFGALTQPNQPDQQIVHMPPRRSIAAMSMAIVSAGPVRDLPVTSSPFETIIMPEWTEVKKIKRDDPDYVQVCRLFNESLSWDKHRRVERCLQINHEWPALWGEFLVKEQEEYRFRARENALKRKRETERAAQAAREQEVQEAQEVIRRCRRVDARVAEVSMARRRGRGRGRGRAVSG